MKIIYIIFIIFFLFSCVPDENSPPIQKNEVSTWLNKQSTGILFSSEFPSEVNSGEVIIKEIEPPIVFNNVSEIENDDSNITKYVNDKIHYTQINYVPKNLVKIKSEFVFDTKWNQTLREEANSALQELAQDFFEQFWVKIKIVSAYRSYNYQVEIKKWGCLDFYCAKAGYSEHQSGLAFDMFEASSNEEFLSKVDLKKYFEWMNENAYKYGFHNSYQKGIDIDGYAIEPWHRRYLWREFAQELYEKKLTYGEYLKKNWQK